MVDFADYTRSQWAGVNADVDIHREEWLGIVDASFANSSIMRPFVNTQQLTNTNQARWDRWGAAEVHGRRAGEEFVAQRMVNEKVTLTVDTTVYSRSVIDDFDDWTKNWDYRQTIAREHGIALAKTFDTAALIRAAKCADYVPATGLTGAHYPGIIIPTSVSNTPADYQTSADTLVAVHREGNEELINRDLGTELYAEGVTFVTPHIFTILLQHNKLQNIEFGAAVGNSFVMARMAYMNGVKVVETPRIPTVAITEHPLGPDFLVTAVEARRQMITIIPRLSLICAQVKGTTYEEYRDPITKATFIDTMAAYNMDGRRPDSVVVVDVTFT